jgi:hypothetical protein
MSAGIDYSGGMSNYDPETGIHYGVIPINDLHEWAWDSFEDNQPPTCPKCGNEMKEDTTKNAKDYRCKKCRQSFYSQDAFSDDVHSWELSDGDYKAFVDSYNDVWVVKSPFYTFAQFCSPCAPGAGHLRYPLPRDDGVKTYCFGHDWFPDDRAPYAVYRVANNSLVPPEEK